MQSQNEPVVCDIVLLGGGHTHVQVLKTFGMQPQAGLRLTLISEDSVSPYSGMLPGCLAGIYQEDEIHINLERLCQFAGARFVRAQATGINLKENRLQLQRRPDFRFDVLSINTGALPTRPSESSVTVKPISDFLPKWHQLLASLQTNDKVLVVGGGAGGVEVAFAARTVMPASCEITIAGRELMPGHSSRLSAKVGAALAKRDIRWLQQSVQCAADGSVELNGWRYPADRVLWVTGVQAPVWYADSDLATDPQGFVTVNAHLQSVSHPNIFAAGDIADLGQQARPKSGVFAVRAGPVLADNLRRFALQQPLRQYRAQRRHLALLGCGDLTAFASRHHVVLGGAISGALLWWLKDRIDRTFMNKFNDLPEMSSGKSRLPAALQAALPEHDDMRCGGCGAKLAADPLRQVLARLPDQSSDQVRLGMGDDAAELVNSSGTSLLSVDGFRAMVSDPYVFGRIVAHHSLNDLFAMAATPTGALAFVTVPFMSEALMAEELYQVLHGVADVLNETGASLVGGHSAEGAELSVALTVVGHAPDTGITKAGCQPGDQLILTKPLGTGTLLAAAMRGLAPRGAVNAAVAGMDCSNAPLVDLFAQHAHALTDVTGFGLLGHLTEMTRASGVGVHVYLDQVPCYAGALEAISQAPSSLQSANELALMDFELRGGLLANQAEVRLLVDPQTSGGLLAAVPAHAVQICVDAITAMGFTAAVVGSIRPAEDRVIWDTRPSQGADGG